MRFVKVLSAKRTIIQGACLDGSNTTLNSFFPLVFFCFDRRKEKSAEGTAFDERIQFSFIRHTRYECITSSSRIHVSVNSFRQRKLRLLLWISVCGAIECKFNRNHTTKKSNVFNATLLIVAELVQ